MKSRDKTGDALDFMDSCRLVLVRFLLLCCPRNVSGIHPSRHHFSRFLERGQVHCISAKVGIHRTKKTCSLVDIRQLQTMLRSPEMSASSGEEDSWHEISCLCSKKSELFLVFLRCGGDLYSNRQEFAPMDLADVRMVLHSRSLPQLFHPWKIWVFEPQEIDDERNSEFVMQENVPRLIFLNFVAWWLRIGEKKIATQFAKERSDP